MTKNIFSHCISEGATKICRGRGEIITDADNNPLRMMGTCQIEKEHLLKQSLEETTPASRD